MAEEGGRGTVFLLRFTRGEPLLVPQSAHCAVPPWHRDWELSGCQRVGLAVRSHLIASIGLTSFSLCAVLSLVSRILQSY